MNRNKVKIRYNSYDKKIEYFWLEQNNEWVQVSEDSGLLKKDYTNVTIQYKLYDIINQINRKYNFGKRGLDIVFEGTKEDFDDVENVVKNYFDKDNIDCVKGNEELISAKDAMPKINNIFEGLNSVLSKYNDDEIKKEINKYNTAVDPEIPICVMGLYSSGKSTFINSLIGDEILDSNSDPTTAKIYKIKNSKDASIDFTFNEEKVRLEFKDNTFNFNNNSDLEILKELKKIKVENKDKTQNYLMYEVLKIINDYDKENNCKAVSELIEIYIPFKNSTLPLEKYDFVIYDTPGSNSATNKEHLDILKEALKNQTNGLPVYITTPDNKDGTDNENLIKYIEEFGDTLDMANTMVIVNKADGISIEELNKFKEKPKDQIVTKWKSTKIYFLSALIGLGAKKALGNDYLIDPTCAQNFDDKCLRFKDRNNKRYSQLYKYNIIQQDKYNKLCDKEKELKDDNELLLLNSGLLSIEKEIGDFAEKYAPYNKCLQARKYLNRAIEKVESRIEKEEQEEKKLKLKWEEKFKEKADDLINILDEFDSCYKLTIGAEFSSEMRISLEELKLLKINEEEDKKNIEEAWEKCKRLDKQIQIEEMQKEVSILYTRYINKYIDRLNKKVEVFWMKKDSEYKEICCKIITENEHLNKEQKEYLRNYVMLVKPISPINVKFDLEKEGAVVSKRFFLFFKKRKKFYLTECKNKYIESLRKCIYEINTNTRYDNIENFRNWSKEVNAGLKQKIAEFNLTLKDLRCVIEKCKNTIIELDKQKNEIIKCRNDIGKFLKFSERGKTYERLDR